MRIKEMVFKIGLKAIEIYLEHLTDTHVYFVYLDMSNGLYICYILHAAHHIQILLQHI